MRPILLLTPESIDSGPLLQAKSQLQGGIPPLAHTTVAAPPDGVIGFDPIWFGVILVMTVEQKYGVAQTQNTTRSGDH